MDENVMSENGKDVSSFSTSPTPAAIISYALQSYVLNEYGKPHVEVAVVWIFVVAATATLWLRREELSNEREVQVGTLGCIMAVATCIITPFFLSILPRLAIAPTWVNALEYLLSAPYEYDFPIPRPIVKVHSLLISVPSFLRRSYLEVMRLPLLLFVLSFLFALWAPLVYMAVKYLGACLEPAIGGLSVRAVKVVSVVVPLATSLLIALLPISWTYTISVLPLFGGGYVDMELYSKEFSFFTFQLYATLISLIPTQFLIFLLFGVLAFTLGVFLLKARNYMTSQYATLLGALAIITLVASIISPYIMSFIPLSSTAPVQVPNIVEELTLAYAFAMFPLFAVIFLLLAKVLRHEHSSLKPTVAKTI